MNIFNFIPYFEFNGEHGGETNGCTRPQAIGLTTIISVQCLNNGKKRLTGRACGFSVK